MSEDEGSSTVCPFCSVGCRLSSTQNDATRVRGVPGRANPDGRLCSKGIRAASAFDSADRLTSPMVRRNGELTETSWEAALDRAARQLDAVRATHGADGLAFFGAPRCTNEENYLLQKLARTLGTNNVDNRARSCHRSSMTAVAKRLGRPAMTNSLTDLGAADAILIIGANPAVQQPIAFDSHIRPAINDDTALIHVDPRQTDTTRLATQHIASRPGSDAAVVTLLTAKLLDREAIDREFVATRTNGFPRFAERLESLDRERLLAEADVPASAVESAVDCLERADRIAVVGGTGIEEPNGGTGTADALLNLLLATGNVGRPGTGFNVFRGLNNEQGAVDMGCRPDRLPGHRPVTDQTARAAVSSVWDTDVPASPGLDERESLEAFGDGVHGVLAVGENPAVEKREKSWIREQFEALEALVVVDVFPTGTTDFADVVLPAAGGLEKHGTVTSLDRLVQPIHPIAEAPRGTKPDFEILRALGRKLTGAFDFDRPADAFAEMQEVCPPYAEVSIEPRGVRWPADDGASTDVLYTDRFHTADGRAEFVPVETRRGPTDGEGLQLVVTSRIGGFAVEGSGDERLHLHPADAETRSITDGDRVIVRSDSGHIVASAHVDDAIRRGTVAIDASAADTLVRGPDRTVRIERAAG